MFRRAIYPGTFDPITNGHIDILKKAANIFDEVILAVADITGKDTLFSTSERELICLEATKNIPKVVVKKYNGLSVKFAQENDAITIVRGLRAVSDFEYELQIALMNKKLYSDIDTMFFVPDSKFLYVSSSMIRSIISLGGDLSDLIPPNVEKALIERFKKDSKFD